MKYTKEDVAHARDNLARTLQDGDTVWTVLEHVSASGMSRNIRVIAIKGGEPYYLSWAVACVLGWPMRNNAVRVSGCGMDIGFHLVDVLGRALGLKLHCRWL